ncbi:MAG TPA: ADOP family duplicated permease, partial [Vicinamibacterales bacterium]
TLALGIGVNSTIFTIANGALFRPMPGLTDANRLAWVSSSSRDGGRQSGLSYPDYADYRDGSSSVFTSMTGFRPTSLSLASGGEPERIGGHFVSGSYFATLGVTPELGRTLTDEDDRRGAGRPVALISHRLWERRFGGTPDILRKTLTINGRSFAVVGVTPRGFSGPALGEAADIWVPLSLWPDLHAGEEELLDARGASWLVVMGRLRPGVTTRQAQAALGTIANRLAHDFPDTNGDRIVTVSGTGSPLSPAGRAEIVPLSALLLAVTALVLLIACANIANLLLARGAARRGELAVRSALGATRGRLVRQLLTESGLLAAAGAVAGLILSFWGADLLVSMLPDDEFQGLLASTDVMVVIFTASLAALSVCAFGIVPAFSAARGALMRRDTPGAGTRTRLQGAFVVAQLSLSLVLLLASGLSVRALQNATRIDPGFDPHDVVAASYDPVLQNYSAERRAAFRRDLLARARAIPGISEATLANVAPLGGIMIGAGVTDMAHPEGESRVMTSCNGVGPGYFRTLAIPVLRGRGIDVSDSANATPVAVVNETLAARLWGDGDPIGRRVRMRGITFEVVGLVKNAKYDELTEDPRAFLYTSLDQQSQIDREVLLVRTRSAAAAGPALKTIFRELDPALPVFDLQTLDAGIAERADKQRAISGLVAAFGVLALLLAAIGLYGVMAYTAAGRRREMGVRLALGATPSQVTRLIAADGLRLALMGVAIGSVLALPLARAL